MKQRGRPKHPDILTPREWEVLELVREGLSNDAIGERLGISLDGVKFHVSEILGRLGVRDRQEAARWQPAGRPWWMAAATPFLFWRKLGLGWVAPAVAGGVAIAAVVGAGLLIWGLTRTQAGTELEYALAETFLNPDPAERDFAGYAVATVGENVLIGVPEDDANGRDSGIAYLFDGGSGALLQTFSNPNPDDGAGFGNAVAGVGGDALIGGPGAAYLFDGSTGALLQTFLDPKPPCGYSFGAAVAGVEGNVLIGARGYSTAAGTLVCASGVEAPSDGGAAYLFDGATGALLQTFLNPTPAAGDDFGGAVAGVGGNALVGARNDDTAAPEAGAVYLFDGSTGALLQTFLGPNGGSFGHSVAGVGEHVLVGAPNEDTGASEAGTAYLFDSKTGALLHTFLNPDPALGDSFGWSVAGVGGNVLVGAPLDDTAGRSAGAAYLFDAGSGALLRTFLSPSPSPGEIRGFGWSLAAMGDSFVVGSPQRSAGAEGAGAAYLFTLQERESDAPAVVLPTAVTWDEGTAIRGAGETLCQLQELDPYEACVNQYFSAVQSGILAVLCVDDEDGEWYFGTAGAPPEPGHAGEASQVGDDCSIRGHVAVALVGGSEP